MREIETDTDTHGETERQKQREKEKRGTERQRGRKRDSEQKPEAQTNIKTKRFANRHTCTSVSWSQMDMQRCPERNTLARQRDREKGHPMHTDPERKHNRHRHTEERKR